MTFGIDGLSSGLDTTGIINQLMQLERQPAVRLEQRISANQKATAALTLISTRMAAVDAAAKALTETSTSFVPRKATSSASHVSATATAGAPVGSVGFSVEQLAASHRAVTSSTVADSTTVVSAAGTNITVDNPSAAGGPFTVAIAAGATLADVATAINESAAGITAQVVDTGNGLKLQFATTTSGLDGRFDVHLTGLDTTAFVNGDTSTVALVDGQDAMVRVGTGAGAYNVTSATNTFSGLLEGVTFTASAAKPGEQVTVAVAEDPSALTGKVKSFVDAVNAALTEIDKQIATGINGGTKGALSGDATMRSLRDRLLGSVTYGVAGSALGSGGLAGVQSTKEGQLTFDETKFKDALAADPAAVDALFRSGDPAQPAIADRVLSLAKLATRSGDGIIATATASRESMNRTFTDQIASIDRRIELRRATLQRQWAGLEVAMGAMQAQQSWLASQVGAMNATNSAR